jgi:hypothetical protein
MINGHLAISGGKQSSRWANPASLADYVVRSLTRSARLESLLTFPRVENAIKRVISIAEYDG